MWPDDTLGDVLRELKRGRSHMALVRDVNNKDETQDPYYEIKGIITLEDIIEEILGDEIVDETDAFVDGSHKTEVNRAETFKWARLRLLHSKIVDETLSHDETLAVTAHLMKNYPNVVSLITENQLERLIASTPVTLLPTAVQEVGHLLPKELLYEKGKPSDVCTLVLAGKVSVLVGEENFRTDVSSWCLLGSGALNDPMYKPDFSAYVSSGPCRCLRIHRSRFVAAIDGSATEKLSHHNGVAALDKPDSAYSRLYPVPSQRNAAVPLVTGVDTKEASHRGKFFQALQIGHDEDKQNDDQEQGGGHNASNDERDQSTNSCETEPAPPLNPSKQS